MDSVEGGGSNLLMIVCHLKIRLIILFATKILFYTWFRRNIQTSNTSKTENRNMTPASQDHTSNNTGKQTSTGQVFDKQQIVSMYDNGVSCEEIPQKYNVPVPRSSLSSQLKNDLTDILARPVIVQTIAITTTTTVISNLTMATFNSVQMVADKLKNFQYYRGTACYKFLINSNIQAVGRMIAVNSPYETSLQSNRALTAGTNITQLFMYPHVEVDFGTGETVTFKIPYMARNSMAKIADIGWTYIYMYMYNALRGTDSGETCELSVLSWWENMELIMPIAQSGKLEWADMEMDQKTERPISEAFSFLSTFSQKFAFVPWIGPYLAGVSWVSGLASHAASQFGYSKPPNNSSVQFMSQMPMRAYTNCEGSDDSVSLSLRPSNKISQHPSNFGSKYDANTLESFLTRQAFVDTLLWDISDPVDTILTDWPLSPVNFPSTPVTIIADHFRHWATGFVFRLSAVKNAFYSGRLAIQWFSTNTKAAYDPAAPSIIFDLKTNHELIFRVPYMSETRVKDYNQANGHLVVFVLNPLRVNPTYPTAIELNLTFELDSSVLFAAPRTPLLTYAQGLSDDECVTNAPGELARKALDIFAVTPQTYNDLAVVDGEVTVSLLDLLKRFNYDFEFFNFNNFYFTPSDTQRHLTSVHPYQRLSNFFRFWRGSFRAKIVVRTPPSSPTGEIDTSASLHVALFYDTTSYNPTNGIKIDAKITNTPNTYVSLARNNVIEISIPYYSLDDRSVVGDNTTTFPIPSVQVQIVPSSTFYSVSAITAVYTAVGEDFQFGFPCGMPKTP